MNSQPVIVCNHCGAENLRQAITCQKCYEVFDGSAGNSIRVSQSVSRRDFLVRQSSNGVDRSRLPDEWRGGPPMIQQKQVVWSAIIRYSTDASVYQDPVPPQEVRPFVLRPDASTNEAAALTLARVMWQNFNPCARTKIVLLSDGEADDKIAAQDAADELKRLGALIATVGVRGPTMDLAHLHKLASAPALSFETQTGGIVSAFVRASQSVSSRRGGEKGPMLVIFVIDESGSMEEDTKKAEVEEAVKASLAHLCTL